MFGIAFVVISLSTDFWVESTPKLRSYTNFTNPVNEANFGLFKGHRNINFGLGQRESDLSVTCAASKGVCVVFPTAKSEDTATEYIDKLVDNSTDTPLYQLGLFNYGYWVTCIISAAFSVVFGIISMGFAVFNVCGKPIETITGPMGLYIWNGIALLFAVLDMVMFLVLFLTTIKKNFFLEEELQLFSTEDYTGMGYSFYMIPCAIAMYLINIILLVCSGYKLRCSFSSEAEKVVDNGMILY